MSIEARGKRVRRLHLGALLVAMVSAVLGTPGTADAHGDEGDMEVLVAEATGSREISVEVGIVYVGDEDLATEAAVTVTARDEAGTSIGPFDVPNTTGAKYATSFDVPGEGPWILTITSTNPDAQQAIEVAMDLPVDTSPPTTGVPDATTSAPGETTTSEATVDTATDPGENASDSSGDDDDNRLAIFVVVLVLVAGGVAFATIVLRGRAADAAAARDDSDPGR